MKRTMHYLTGGLLAVALVAGGISFAGSAAAQTATPPSSTATPAPSADPAPWFGGRGHGRSGGDTALLPTVAAALGITPDEVRARLDADTSLADLLTAAELDPAAVAADYLSAKRAELDAAVAAGTLTATQAEVIYADHAARVDAQLTAVLPAFAGGRRTDHRLLAQNVADALELTLDQLHDQLSADVSMADLLSAADVDQTVVISGYLNDLRAELDQAVTAGTLTQAQADARFADAEATAADRLAQTMPLHDGRGGHRHGQGRGGHGMGGMRNGDCAPGSAQGGTESGFRFGAPRTTTTD
jgi:hypothetical protein